MSSVALATYNATDVCLLTVKSPRTAFHLDEGLVGRSSVLTRDNFVPLVKRVLQPGNILQLFESDHGKAAQTTYREYADQLWSDTLNAIQKHPSFENVDVHTAIMAEDEGNSTPLVDECDGGFAMLAAAAAAAAAPAAPAAAPAALTAYCYYTNTDCITPDDSLGYVNVWREGATSLIQWVTFGDRQVQLEITRDNLLGCVHDDHYRASVFLTVRPHPLSSAPTNHAFHFHHDEHLRENSKRDLMNKFCDLVCQRS
jgi:hypothetical protein